MEDTTRPIPVQLRPSETEAIDAYAVTERVSRSALLRAAIVLGLRQITADPALLKELVPPPTFNRGILKPRRVKASSAPIAEVLSSVLPTEPSAT